MKTADFDYKLPPELIAQEPIEPRDSSRLMVLDRGAGTIEQGVFREILELLRPGDCLVANSSRVFPARILGRKETTGGKVELLIISERGPGTWEALARPARRLRKGTVINIGDGEFSAEVMGAPSSSMRIVRFYGADDIDNELRRWGRVPLPPYIKGTIRDPERYQTVYSKDELSAAAPTAGLHFTRNLIDELKRRGIGWVEVELSVGMDTFTPVRKETVEEHTMHSEEYEIGREAVDAINEARNGGGRVVAVGTTVVRALETAADAGGHLAAARGETDLFIYPGYSFRAVDALITNFHFPRSTLLMLVCAFAGRDLVMRAYEKAVRERYRFYSFGDAMMII